MTRSTSSQPPREPTPATDVLILVSLLTWLWWGLHV